MKIKFFCALLACIACAHGGADPGAPLADNKQTIQKLQVRWKEAPETNKPELLAELSKAYYKDQNVEKSFQVYLEALKGAGADHSFVSPAEDHELYGQALKVYLEHHGLTFLEAERKILDTYGPLIKKNPDLRELGFVVSAAYANLGQFSDFFDTFYRSYTAYPDHYMAYKTKAILHIKLFERERPGTEKEAQRLAILENLEQASNRFPSDSSLYKLMIVFAPEPDKANILAVNLNKIINRNIIIPRADLEFFIRQALIADRADLAQKFLDKAREWYQYSRVIDAAQEHIDKIKTKHLE